MVAGAVARSKADTAVAITGIAGPGGGTAVKPVGLVYIACRCGAGEAMVARHEFGEIGRGAVRQASLAKALEMLATSLVQAPRP